MSPRATTCSTSSWRPDRSVTVKDEDELAAAISAGWVTPAEATAWRRDLEAAVGWVGLWQSPFHDPWPEWRPDPTWPVPPLPDDSRDGSS